MSRFFITGDIHGSLTIDKFFKRNFKAGKELTHSDYACIAGDFGLIWYPDGHIKKRTDDNWLKWLSERKWTTLFVDGNHENFELLYQYPLVDFHGGKARKIRNNVYHLDRGYVFDFDGKKILTMGGAKSIDKWDRIKGVDWWPQEEPCYNEYERLLANVMIAKYSVDYVITHNAPLSIIHKMGMFDENRVDQVSKFFDHLKNDLQFTKWFFGHFHEDIEVDKKFTAVYDNIIEVEL